MSLLDAVFVICGSGFIVSSLWWSLWFFPPFWRLVTLVSGIFLVIFPFFPDFLAQFGKIFGLERWADAIVYIAIIVLFVGFLRFLWQNEKDRQQISTLFRDIALSGAYIPANFWQNSSKDIQKQWQIFGKFKQNHSSITPGPSNIVFLVRAYNEWTRLVETLQSILDAGFWQILVVDDGSTDDTREKISKKFDNIFYIRHPSNRWAGAALETGFEFVRQNADRFDWQWVVTFDADGQMQVDDMIGFLEFLGEHPEAQVVFGSRFLQKTSDSMPLYRKIILLGGKFFTFFISRVWLSDAHNGYRMFTVDVVRQFRLTLDGMEYASELIDELQKLSIKISEIPVTILYSDETLAKGQRFGGAVRIALKMIFKKFF